jgi:hypothetical protein
VDEDEWLESEEGQRWTAEFVSKGQAAARDMQKLAAAFENFGYEIAEMRAAREPRSGGASETVVSKELIRITRGNSVGPAS